jgi:hypothetical protein
MHGAGYNERYYGGPNALAHGVYTDDYMATEVLTGHPAMGIESFGRDVVRKYWFLHDLMRALAMRRMEEVEFAGADFHRQRVKWAGGGEIAVNRGESDWQVDGHTLPQYGFYADVAQGSKRLEAAIEKKGGNTVEWSRSVDGLYVNGRGNTTDFGAVETAGAARVTRDAGSLMVMAPPDGGDFSLRLRWSKLPESLPTPHSAEALDETGAVIRTFNLFSTGGVAVLNYQGKVFAYRLR